MKNLKLYEDFYQSGSGKKTIILAGPMDHDADGEHYQYEDEYRDYYPFDELTETPLQKIALYNGILIGPDDEIVFYNIHDKDSLEFKDPDFVDTPGFDNNIYLIESGLLIVEYTDEEIEAYKFGWSHADQSGTGGSPQFLIIDDKILSEQENLYKFIIGRENPKDMKKLKKYNPVFLKKMMDYYNDPTFIDRLENTEGHKDIINL